MYVVLHFQVFKEMMIIDLDYFERPLSTKHIMDIKTFQMTVVAKTRLECSIFNYRCIMLVNAMCVWKSIITQGKKDAQYTHTLAKPTTVLMMGELPHYRKTMGCNYSSMTWRSETVFGVRSCMNNYIPTVSYRCNYLSMLYLYSC